MPVTFEEMLECVLREIKQRQRVYPRLVEQGKMTKELASRELARMEAIRDHLNPLAQKERLI